MSKTASGQFSNAELCALGIHAIRTVIRQILDDAENDPQIAFEEVIVGKRKKPALRIDVGAEDTVVRRIHCYKGNRYKTIHFLGEERLADESLDLTGRAGTWVLADALDGTDLIERGLGNWCSALIFYHPTNPAGSRIAAAVVGMPNGDIYYSSQDDSELWVERKGRPRRKAYGAVQSATLDDVTLCFYGQKIGGLVSLYQTQLFGAPEVLTSEKVRFQTLAGIPMMLKLVDRFVREGRGIDIVFDTRGQKPHDVVPGAYLCLKAGAHLLKLQDGSPLTIEQLEASLLKPASKEHKLRYVMGPSEQLTTQVCALLSSSRTAAI